MNIILNIWMNLIISYACSVICDCKHNNTGVNTSNTIELQPVAQYKYAANPSIEPRTAYLNTDTDIITENLEIKEVKLDFKGRSRLSACITDFLHRKIIDPNSNNRDNLKRNDYNNQSNRNSESEIIPNISDECSTLGNILFLSRIFGGFILIVAIIIGVGIITEKCLERTTLCK